MLKMTASAVQKAKTTRNKRFVAQICISICVFSIILFIAKARRNNDPLHNGVGKSHGMLEGSTPSGTSYYSCGRKTNPSIVLLHGARYTKEDWKTSGIMERFCNNDVSVAALDLSVRATSSVLSKTLSELSVAGVVSTPVGGIVTPSASGFTMIDGILNGNVGLLRKDIHRWIPVATNAANQLSAKDLVPARAWPILAIYGDQDISGKQSSMLWKNVAEAKVVELKVRAV